MIRKNLKIRRIEKNISQLELAEMVGVANTTISSYETGRANPGYKTMKKISEALDSTVDHLFYKNKEE